MFYKNVETYLNEEYVKPIKYFADRGENDLVYSWVCSLANKYKEMNTHMLAYEKMLERHGEKIDFKEFRSSLEEVCGNEFGYVYVDFSKLESPFTEEEQQARINELNAEIEMLGSGEHGSGENVGSSDVGGLISSLRKNQGVSLVTLAHEIGISKQTLWNIEHGDCSGRFDTISKILGALGYEFCVKRMAKK